MSRLTWIFGATTVIGFALSGYLFVENRALSETHPVIEPTVAATPTPTPTAPKDPWLDAKHVEPAGPAAVAARDEPKLPEQREETKMEKRARRTLEIAAILGRHEGESEEDYRARVVPLVQTGLAIPRDRVNEQRKVAEEKANITPAQHAALDKAFEKTYADIMDYTNKAIADGTLSPYERNVSGWLEFAGGMGGLLSETNGAIAKILDPSQIKAMSDAGFEWGEYLGFNAPWESLKPPPPQK